MSDTVTSPDFVTQVQDGQRVRVTRTWEGVVQNTRTRPARQTRDSFSRMAQDFTLTSEVHGGLNLSTDYEGQSIVLLEQVSPFKVGDMIDHSNFGRLFAVNGRVGGCKRLHFVATDGSKVAAHEALRDGTWRYLSRG